MKDLEHPTGPIDFRSLDFDRLWNGREKTTEVERRVVREALLGRDSRRILEVGPGGGRIASELLASGREYVGVDVTLEFLVRLRARWGGSARWVAADLHRLPFVPASFSGAVLVRVFNFLTDPEGALRELHRVLAPGGFLLVSYYSEPSVATFGNEVRRKIRDPEPVGSASASGPREKLLPSRRTFRARVSSAGFLWEREYSVGLEDVRALRWLPAEVFLGLARTFGPAPALPHHFVLLRTPGRLPLELPPLEAILACPDCRTTLPSSRTWDVPSPRCPGCGRELPVVDGVPDLRPTAPAAKHPGAPVVRVRAPK